MKLNETEKKNWNILRMRRQNAWLVMHVDCLHMDTARILLLLSSVISIRLNYREFSQFITVQIQLHE